MPTMLAAVSFCRMQTSPKPSFDADTAITISAVDQQQSPHRIEEECGVRQDAGAGRQRDIQSHAAAGQVGGIVDQFAQHLDQRQAGDREVMAAQPQQHDAEQAARGRSRRPAPPAIDIVSGRPCVEQHAGRIGAKAEERRGRKRRIAGKAADDIPRQREDRIHAGHGAEPQRIGAAEQRQRRQAGAARSAAPDWPGHSNPFRPSSPCGRTTRNTISSAKDSVVA